MSKRRKKKQRGALSCPKCKSGYTLTDTVIHEGTSKTVRTHVCEDCDEEFTTVQERGVYVGWARESQA